MNTRRPNNPVYNEEHGSNDSI